MITDDYHYTLFKREGTGRNNAFYYYYSYYDENGKRIKRSTGLTNEKKARAYVNRLIAEGKFKEAPKVSRNPTFREFAEENHFWEYDKCPIVRDALARKGKYSRDNCKANGDCMRKNIYPTFGNVKLSRITKAMINNWMGCSLNVSNVISSSRVIFE